MAPGSGRKRGRRQAEVELDETATLLGAARSSESTIWDLLHGKVHKEPPHAALSTCLGGLQLYVMHTGRPAMS